MPCLNWSNLPSTKCPRRATIGLCTSCTSDVLPMPGSVYVLGQIHLGFSIGGFTLNYNPNRLVNQTATTGFDSSRPRTGVELTAGRWM